MQESSEGRELIRAVKKRGEAVSTVAARLGVFSKKTLNAASTASQKWRPRRAELRSGPLQ